MFKPYSREVVDFCAEECYRQKSGERSVAYMVAAWEYMDDVRDIEITSTTVERLGQFVEPHVNQKGYRVVPVTVSGSVSGSYQFIPRQIDNLCEAINEDRLTAAEAYQEFEEIHPFKDGNGRVGSIIYNWMRGGNPKTPPPYRDRRDET